MQEVDDDLVTRPITKNTIPAAGAPKLLTTAPSSVFALGGVNIDAAHAEPLAPVKPRPRAPAVPRDRAIETIRSCGELNKTQFASALNLSTAQSQKMLMKLQAEGEIEGRKVKGELTAYRVADAASANRGRGFKGWLERKGEPSAEGRTSKKRTPVGAIENAPATPESVDDGFVCGLFNTGELVLEADGQTMRLTKIRARALVAYLDKLATAMQG